LAQPRKILWLSIVKARERAYIAHNTPPAFRNSTFFVSIRFDDAEIIDAVVVETFYKQNNHPNIVYDDYTIPYLRTFVYQKAAISRGFFASIGSINFETRGNNFAKADAASLRAALPNCEIHF
jgi:hypothetical protein